MEFYEAQPTFGKRCPRCGDYGCFQIPNGKPPKDGKKKTPQPYFCDSCDPKRKKPIAAARVEQSRSG